MKVLVEGRRERVGRRWGHRNAICIPPIVGGVHLLAVGDRWERTFRFPKNMEYSIIKLKLRWHHISND